MTVRTLKPLSPFVPARRVITPAAQTGRDCLAAHGHRNRVAAPSLSFRPKHRSTRPVASANRPSEFYSGHTPPLRRFTFLHSGVATFTPLTKTGHRIANPEAAVVPALASVFDSEVTSLGHVTARSARVCAVSRRLTLSAAAMTIVSKPRRFPPTKSEARGIGPARMFAVRYRLLRVLLASPPLPIRLGLSWLSFSPPGFCRHATAFAGSPG